MGTETGRLLQKCDVFVSQSLNAWELKRYRQAVVASIKYVTIPERMGTET